MKTTRFVLTAILLLIVVMGGVQAKVIRDAIWSDGDLYGVTITPQDLPVQGPFDTLYNFDASGLTGQRSVSESHPGEQDYNGGRWEVVPVTFTALGISVYDPDGDDAVNSEFTSDQEIMDAVDAGYLTIGDPIRHFVCPLHPQKS